MAGTFRLLFSLFADEEDEEEVIDLDDLLSNSIFSLQCGGTQEFSPGAGEALIDERDQYIAEKIMQAKTEEKMLVVVGAGHLKGIERALTPYSPLAPERMQEISTVPKKGMVGKTLPFAIPLIVMGLVGFALYNNDDVDIVKMLTVWTLFNNTAQLAVFLHEAILWQFSSCHGKSNHFAESRTCWLVRRVCSTSYFGTDG